MESDKRTGSTFFSDKRLFLGKSGASSRRRRADTFIVNSVSNLRRKGSPLEHPQSPNQLRRKLAGDLRPLRNECPGATGAASPPAQTDATIPPQAMLQPAELVQMLNTSAKPLVLQTGSHVLYAEAHIPGSEYAGPTGTSAGIEALRARVTGLNKDTLIVIYCGCCPWSRCPNIKPAYQQLRSLGFTNVKALYLAQNFGTDWVDKGYPVAKGR